MRELFLLRQEREIVIKDMAEKDTVIEALRAASESGKPPSPSSPEAGMTNKECRPCQRRRKEVLEAAKALAALDIVIGGHVVIEKAPEFSIALARLCKAVAAMEEQDA